MDADAFVVRNEDRASFVPPDCKWAKELKGFVVRDEDLASFTKEEPPDWKSGAEELKWEEKGLYLPETDLVQNDGHVFITAFRKQWFKLSLPFTIEFRLGEDWRNFRHLMRTGTFHNPSNGAKAIFEQLLPYCEAKSTTNSTKALDFSLKGSYRLLVNKFPHGCGAQFYIVELIEPAYTLGYHDIDPAYTLGYSAAFASHDFRF